MTERRVLVLNTAGVIEELQSGDSVESIPPLHLCGLTLSNGVDAGKVNVAPGKTKTDDNQYVMTALSTLTADLAVSGINGLDTGSEQSDAFYYVFVIYKPTTQTVATLLSLSSTAPTLPLGYTHKRRIGTVRNKSGGLLAFATYGGCSRFRRFNYLEDRSSTLRVLSTGNATSWSDVDCSSLIPPMASVACYDAESISKNSYLRPKGLTIANYHKLYQNTVVTFDMESGTNQITQYYLATPGGSLSLSVRGFYEEL